MDGRKDGWTSLLLRCESATRSNPTDGKPRKRGKIMMYGKTERTRPDTRPLAIGNRYVMVRGGSAGLRKQIFNQALIDKLHFDREETGKYSNLSNGQIMLSLTSVCA